MRPSGLLLLALVASGTVHTVCADRHEALLARAQVGNGES